MGEVVPFPIKNRRIKPAAPRRQRVPAEAEPLDLDRLAKVAAYSVQIRALSRFAGALPGGGEAEVVFRGERRRLTRKQLFGWAYGMIEDRDPLLTNLGDRGAGRVMRECAAAFRLSRG